MRTPDDAHHALARGPPPCRAVHPRNARRPDHDRRREDGPRRTSLSAGDSRALDRAAGEEASRREGPAIWRSRPAFRGGRRPRTGTRVRGHLSGPRNAAASATERERCMPRCVTSSRRYSGRRAGRPLHAPASCRASTGVRQLHLVPSGHSVSPRARSSWSTCSCLRLIRCSTKCSSASDRGSSPALGMTSCSLAMISRSDSTIPRTASMASVA
jgi:hypothetical protein